MFFLYHEIIKNEVYYQSFHPRIFKKEMAFTDIYDLYNQRLTADQPYVDSCVSAIKTQIETYTNTYQLFYFDFDLTDLIGSLDVDTQIRIKDQIIFTLKNIGIRCYLLYTGVTNTPGTPNYQPYAINFNSKYITVSLLLHVEWFIRNDREFMKAYV